MKDQIKLYNLKKKGKILTEDVRSQIHSMDITEEHIDGVTINYRIRY